MNENTTAATKAAVQQAIDKLQPQLIDLALQIHHHPETKFEEHKASQWLAEAAGEAGFQVEKPIGGLEKTFRATYAGAGTGPTMAFLAEYDALPKLGHACGHNLIGTASLGAALGTREVMSEIPGCIQLIGTPGEEGGGGKVILADELLEKVKNCARGAALARRRFDSPSLLCYTFVTIEYCYGRGAPKLGRQGHNGGSRWCVRRTQSPALSRNCNSVANSQRPDY